MPWSVNFQIEILSVGAECVSVWIFSQLEFLALCVESVLNNYIQLYLHYIHEQKQCHSTYACAFSAPRPHVSSVQWTLAYWLSFRLVRLSSLAARSTFQTAHQPQCPTWCLPHTGTSMWWQACSLQDVVGPYWSRSHPANKKKKIQ